jgi:dTDP-glucose 4,6-dehydratase
MITNALDGKPLPIYGDGKNVRDWLYVEDHCRAICSVLQRGRIGEVYNIGGHCELGNTELVEKVCAILDRKQPMAHGGSYRSLISYVKDRPGHDRRYAIDDSKVSKELGWRPAESIETGLEKTVDWYLENGAWTSSVRDGSYREWIKKNYVDRETST